MQTYFGYRLYNWTIEVRRYTAEVYAKASDAETIIEMTEPFEAQSEQAALAIARRLLGKVTMTQLAK